MKRVLVIILAVFFALAITSVSFAVEEKTAPAPAEKKVEPAKPTEPKTQITGEVKAVDTEAKTVTVVKKVKDKVVEVVVTVDDKTKITHDKAAKTFADVVVGTKVTAKFKAVGDKKVATSIRIKELPKVAPAAPATK